MDTKQETGMVVSELTQDFAGLAMLSQTGRSIAEILQANVGAGGISRQDLTAIKVPSGGGVIWQVDEVTGPKGYNSIYGIILFGEDHRTYFSKPKGEGSESDPPDCSSSDTVSGYGDPGGLCERCEFSKWYSDPRGKGQACKLRRRLFILPHSQRLPYVVDLPSGSLMTMRQYGLKLTSALGIEMYEVTTDVGLEAVKNKAGQSYSRVTFQMREVLTPEQAAVANAYAEGLQSVLIPEDNRDDAPDAEPERTELSEPPAGLSTAPVDAEDPFGANE